MREELSQRLNIIVSVFFILILSYIWIQTESKITKKFKEEASTNIYVPLSMTNLMLLRNEPAISEFYLITGIMQFVSDARNMELIAKELYTGYKADPYIKETIFFLGNVLPIKKDEAKIANKYLKIAATHKLDWHIFLYIGYNLLFNLKDYDKAARFFYIASKLPGAKPYVQSMLIMAYYRKNDIEGALLYLNSLYKEAKTTARKKLILKKMEWLQNIIELNKKIKMFYKKEHRYPENLKELVILGYIKEIPKDPFGKGYYFDKKTHRVRSKW